jgi:Tfp pilus assembly protein PilF
MPILGQTAFKDRSGQIGKLPQMERISTSNRRLDTWKEIGAFFGRDERTVKRWEVTRGLPVHRLPGGGRANVYANTEELVEWLKGKNVAVEAEAISNAAASAEADGTPEAGAMANGIVGAGSIPLGGNGDQADVGGVERRVGQRRTAERSGGALPVWREAVYIAIAMVILATLGIVGVARRVSSARVETKKTTAPRAVDPEAEQFYLKGMYYFNKRTPETLNQAVDYFTQAVVRDPQYAEAYVGLADCYNLLREYTVMPSTEAYPRAMAAAKRAIALDDSLSGAHSSLAFVDFYWSWDVAGAEREFLRAIELDPKSVLAHHWYATFLLALGRLPESLQEIETAQQLDPQSNAILADKGLILFHNGQKEQAVTLLKQIETAEPDFLSPHNYLALIYFVQGDYRQYLVESRIAATLLHDERRLAIVGASEKGFASGGSRAMLNAMLKEQQTLHDNGREAAYSLAGTYAALGEKKEALDNLQNSYQKREPELLAIRIDPWLDNLHGEGRYRELIAKIGLSPVQ